MWLSHLHRHAWDRLARGHAGAAIGRLRAAIGYALAALTGVAVILRGGRGAAHGLRALTGAVGRQRARDHAVGWTLRREWARSALWRWTHRAALWAIRWRTLWARLDRELGQASTRADTLLRAVHADTEGLETISGCAWNKRWCVDLPIHRRTRGACEQVGQRQAPTRRPWRA